MMSDTHEQEMDQVLHTETKKDSGPRGPTVEEQARFAKQELKQSRKELIGHVVQGILANHHYLQNNCKDEKNQLVSMDGIATHAVKLTDALIKELDK